MENENWFRYHLRKPKQKKIKKKEYNIPNSVSWIVTYNASFSKYGCKFFDQMSIYEQDQQKQAHTYFMELVKVWTNERNLMIKNFFEPLTRSIIFSYIGEEKVIMNNYLITFLRLVPGKAYVESIQIDKQDDCLFLDSFVHQKKIDTLKIDFDLFYQQIIDSIFFQDFWVYSICNL